MIPILGYVISIAVAIVMFVLSLGFYCGFIRAIQTMIDNGNVTFGSFFFALKDTKFLIKIAPFAIIIGLAMSVVSGIIGYLCYLAIIKAESQVLFYVLLLLFVLADEKLLPAFVFMYFGNVAHDFIINDAVQF